MSIPTLAVVFSQPVRVVPHSALTRLSGPPMQLLKELSMRETLSSIYADAEKDMTVLFSFVSG